jgi:AcrR family transcriptional regulator
MASRVPQRADAQRNRERLLAAAETAFNAQGAGASLDDIAKAAGVGNATLYRHFPTRAKLLEAVYDQRIAELCAAAAELGQPAAPARALHKWLRAVVAHVTDRRVLTDAFLTANEGPADIEPAQFAAWHNALFDAGRPLLAAAQNAGTARRDVDIAELLALVTGVARAGNPAQAERFLSVLLEGITPRLARSANPLQTSRGGHAAVAFGAQGVGHLGDRAVIVPLGGPEPGLGTHLDCVPGAAERRGVGQVQVADCVDGHVVEDGGGGDVDPLGDLGVPVPE